MSGDAMVMSKSVKPFSIRSARSAAPTKSAPAASASLALSPSANTAILTLLPVPRGRLTEPRTSWSVFLASMPMQTATSTVSSNLGPASDLISAIPSARGYRLLRSTLAAAFW